MNVRLAFPFTMFTLAAVSFSYGIWQHLAAQSVQTAADRRVAHILGQVEQLGVGVQTKQELYASIFREYPQTQGILGIDFSGSFAAPTDGDGCADDGQRSVCRALEAGGSDETTFASVCGACNPE